MSENGKQVEAEVVDADIEPSPEAGGIVSLHRGGIDDMLYLAENIDRMIEAQNKIRGAILKLAQAGDWVIFGEGEKAKAEIGAAGAFRINAVVGISFTNWSKSKEDWHRRTGPMVPVGHGMRRPLPRPGHPSLWPGRGPGTSSLESPRGNGSRSTRSTRATSRSPRIGPPRKKGSRPCWAFTTWTPRSLRNTTSAWNAPQATPSSQRIRKAEELQTATVEVAEITLKKGDNWTKYTIKDAEGAVYGTFSEAHAKTAKEAREQKVLVTIAYKTGKFGNEIVSLDLVAKIMNLPMRADKGEPDGSPVLRHVLEDLADEIVSRRKK
jgi:hypothetical protein